VDEILSAIGFSVMDESWQEVKQEIEKLWKKHYSSSYVGKL
jgi:hypothetical protein